MASRRPRLNRIRGAQRALGILVVLGVLMFAGLVGWMVRDSLGPNADLAATWTGLLEVVGRSLPVALGAVIGAGGALVVAVLNRQEAARSRYAMTALGLATDVMVEADVHARELRAVVLRLMEAVEENASAGSMPKLHDTEAVRRAYLSLGLLDKDLGTKGEAIYKVLVRMDKQTEQFRLDPWQEYQSFDYEAYKLLLDDYFAAMDDFRDTWRSRPS
jgi:hypothetical protein